MFRKILAFSVITFLFASPFASTAQVNTSDDSDLFALPTDKPSLADAIATADDRAEEVKAKRIVAEDEFKAAEEAVRSLQNLSRGQEKVSSDDSDLFALPKRDLSADIAAASKEADAAERQLAKSEEELKDATKVDDALGELVEDLKDANQPDT